MKKILMSMFKIIDNNNPFYEASSNTDDIEFDEWKK